MKGKSSILYILFILLGISVAIVGMFIGCDENKQVNPPVFGPAAGSGPVGGGETQKVTIINEPVTLYLAADEPSTLDIVALIENNIGQPMPDGTPVYWTVEGSNATTATSSNGSSTYTWNIDKIFDGCVDITARSGDASDTVRICVARVKATPTPAPAPTATPGPAPTATPARTLEIISPTPPTYTLSCPTPPGTCNLDIVALATNGGVPENGIPVTFAVYGAGLGPVPATPINTGPAGTATANFINCSQPNVVTVVASTTDGRTASITINVGP